MGLGAKTTGCLGSAWRDESGQSSLFAILALFVLLAAMAYAYNVSMVVSKRVRLQNAADAAALSGAMVEANALSAIAWLNGCQTYIHSRMQEVLLDVPPTATATATAEWGRYIMNRHGYKTFDMNGKKKLHPVEWNHGDYKSGLLGIFDQLSNTIDAFKKMFGIDEDPTQKLSPEDAAKAQELINKLKEMSDRGEVGSDEYMRTLDELEKLGVDVGMLRANAKLQRLENERLRIQAELTATETALRQNLEFLATANARKPTCDPYPKNPSVLSELNKFYSSASALGNNGLNGNRSGLSYQPGFYRLRQKNIDRTSDAEQPIDTLSTPTESNWWEQYVDDQEFDSFIKYLRNESTANLNAASGSGGMAYRIYWMNYYLERGDTNFGIFANPQWSSSDVDAACIKAHNTHIQAIKDALNKVKNCLPTMEAARKRLREIYKEMEKERKNLDDSGGLTKEQRNKLYDEAEKQLDEMKKPKSDSEKADVMRSVNDPPEIWSITKLLPIPAWNPNGPFQQIGRMTPLGTDYSVAGVKDPKKAIKDMGYERPENPFLKDKKKYGDNAGTKDGLPIWDELVVAMAGPYAGTIWPALMKEKYGYAGPFEDTDDFLDFFHGVMLPEAKKWVGYRSTNGTGGIRPGEVWIRQLSQIAAAIAGAMPKLVRNEIMYTVSINASQRTVTAIFPDPEDTAKWGEVVFAQTDRAAGEAFFRYDGWFAPPAKHVKDLGDKTWIPPPNYVNLYTATNSSLPLVDAAVKFNNRSVWKGSDNYLYGNRFLNESRRQNMLMRRDRFEGAGNVKKGAALFGVVKSQEAASSVHLPLPTYAMLVDESDNPKQSDAAKLGYFRMRYAESFYWDEYAGKVGGDRDTDGAGNSVRVAVTCWNQNDRTWRAPKGDSKNNNVMLVDAGFMMDGLSSPFAMLPGIIAIPGPGSGQWSFSAFLDNMGKRPPINKNTAPRCNTGYAPGSNVVGMGHPLFIPCHGDPAKEDGAADGHWHYMHYHAHSESCQHVFPGIAGCSVVPINCILYNLIAMMINGLADSGDSPNRTAWDGTAHYPYKHWDGTVVDDAGDAVKHHIFCRLAIDNKKDSTHPLLYLDDLLGRKDRRPPFAITLSKAAIQQLIPPLSLYNVCLFKCPALPILPGVEICICLTKKSCVAGIGSEGLHGSSGEFKYMPKDIIPLYNMPALWNKLDSDPSLLTLFGANLNWGDIEGDPLMFVGSGDRLFYPEIIYKISNTRATGRHHRYTEVLAGADLLAFGQTALTNVIKDMISDLLKDKLGPFAGIFEKLFDLTTDNLDFPPIVTSDDVDLSKGDTYKLYRYADNNIENFNAIMTTLVDILSRWGHHRFITCPLCMSECPIPNCDVHKHGASESGDRVQRHWGGDYGGATDVTAMRPAVTGGFGGLVGTYYKAISNFSVMPALYSSGDQRADAGMSYASVMRGHDLFKFNEPEKHWFDSYRGSDAKAKKRQQNKHVNSGSQFDLGIDLDDGLEGNGRWKQRTGRNWTDMFPTDRFVREWMSPVRGGASSPDTGLAPAVVATENFMRHGLTVVLIEDYRPMFPGDWMFGKRRPMMAVATAKCGFIERDDIGVNGTPVVIDGRGGEGGVPQIIAGIGEPYRSPGSGEMWDLDRVWEHFLDFPNKAPLGESNLYYANWGAKLVPTYYGILRNRDDSYDHPRRSSGGYRRHTGIAECHQALWAQLGPLEYYGPNGVRYRGQTVAGFCRMSPGEWTAFANEIVDTSAGFIGGYDDR